MKKIVPFLEKHVQWIALGLGGLYLGYMIWLYAVQTPVLVTGIAPTPLTPGEVDPFILQTAAQPLESAMSNTSVPDITVPHFIDQFKADMSFSNLPLYALDWFPDGHVQSIDVKVNQKNPIVADLPITALPTLPPAVYADFSTGRSSVQPFPVAGVNPAAPAPGPNGVVPVALGADKCWVTVSYKISPSALAKAFKTVNIPAWTEHTTVLEIHLWREEEIAGGKWSDPKPMTPINGQLLLPLPVASDNLGQQAYLTWAVQHVSDILQPAFYQVNKGDQWRAPGQVLVVMNQPAAPAPLDPSKAYPLSVLHQYSDDDRKKYFQDRNKLKSSQPRPSGRSPGGAGPGSGGPGSSGPGGRLYPSPGQIGSEVYADVQAPQQDDSAGGPSGPYGRPSDAPPGAAPAAQPAALAAMFPIPPGDFDPNAVSTDITGWAHDDTAQPGHTYRYMITYSIKNPIFGAGAAKINPALAAVFDIQSPQGQWSQPINVASTTNFFVYANSRPGAPSARFKVYKWQNGVERSKVFEVAPGDIIGGIDGDVDFNSGWTVVDLRFDDPHNPDSMTILVMDPNGILDRRDYRTDQAKPELKALDQQVSNGLSTDQLAGGSRTSP